MNELHRHLEENDNLYASWHKKLKISAITHWALLVLVSFMLTNMLLGYIDPSSNGLVDSVFAAPPNSQSGSGKTSLTASLSVSPTAINAGGSATLTWSTQNASNASISPGIGSVALSGSVTVSPLATTTYTLTATKGNSTAIATTTVNVALVSAYYVSPSGSDTNPGTDSAPFKTIGKAQTTVRSINQAVTGDITVYLRGGVYQVTTVLNFNELDSGFNNHQVVWKAYPGETPILSGGQHITSWASVGNGIYKANVGSLKFRQLYVNGRRAIRARTPNVGYYYRTLGWDISNNQIKVLPSQLPGVNSAEMMLVRHWEQNKIHIASSGISGEYGYIAPQQAENSSLTASTQEKRPNQAFHYENSLSYLDAEDEWFLDDQTGDLYYKPISGELISSSIVIVPITEQILKVDGQVSPVKNLVFEGLTFEYTTWLSPTSEGYVGTQANHYFKGSNEYSSIPAGVMFTNAENTTFSKNTLRYMGGVGLAFAYHTKGNRIIGNVFHDIAGNGLAVNFPAADIYNPNTNSQNDVVSNNYITRIGQDYPGSVGIFAGTVNGITIEHNEIEDTPYTAINLGWGWTDTASTLGNNIVRYNKIQNVVKNLDDGGGIYTLSKQPGTQIYENSIKNAQASAWADNSPIGGIYLDNGTSFVTVRDNSIGNTQIAVHQNFGGVPAHDNTITNSSGTIVTVDQNAGLEPTYQGIKDKVPSTWVPSSETPALSRTQIGLYRPNTSQWYLDTGNHVEDGCTVDLCRTFGEPNMSPVIGDWNNDGKDDLGTFNPSNASWTIDLNGNGTFDSCTADKCFVFGLANDVPVSGDWDNDNVENIGVYRPSDAGWSLDLNENYQWDGVPPDGGTAYGLANDKPVSGKWSRLGKDSMGIARYDSASNAWNWALDFGDISFTSCNDDLCTLFGTGAGLTPLMGDWDGNGYFEPGFYNPTTAEWRLDNGNFVWEGCAIDACFTYGVPGDKPLLHNRSMVQ